MLNRVLNTTPLQNDRKSITQNHHVTLIICFMASIRCKMSEAYLEPCQVSQMEHFLKTSN